MTDLEFRVAALHWLHKRVGSTYKELHDQLALTMRSGARLPAVSPGDERPIANASMSVPARDLVVTDREALTDWYAKHAADHTEEVYAVTGSDDEVIAVLREYAPHLVSARTRIRDWAMTELRETSKAARVPIGPGGEMDLPGVGVSRPQPRLTVRLTDDADDVIGELITQNRLTLDGHVRELEA